MIHTFLTRWSILLLTALVIPQHTFAQDLVSEELRFEVRKVDPPLTISQHQIQEAHRLADLNNEANELDLYFKPSWIRSYVSVEIVAIHQGKQRKAVGKNDILTQEQKEIIQHADAGTPIAAHIQYLPENTLSHNEVKSLDFEVNVKPLQDARFPGGQQKLKDYLASNAVDKIPEGSFQPTDFAAVQFTINESGEVVDAQVFESGYQLHPHDKANAILLEAVRQMPSWEAAEFCKGTTISQNYVFVVGNLESCLNNLITFR
ncbi:MAG TPA: energy transducer TonB [Saprospiraceae bacterium]|nr:energy transducer TonB [Saprospiraceae bacterium]